MPTTPTERESCLAQFRKMQAEGVDLNRYERTFLAVADELDEAVRLLELARPILAGNTPRPNSTAWKIDAFLTRTKGRP